MSWDDPTNEIARDPLAYDSCFGNDWEGDELDQLRMDIEEIQIDRDEMEVRMTRAKDSATRARNRAGAAFKSLKLHRSEVAKEFSETNKTISDKCMVYLDLINEYEAMVYHQARYTSMVPMNAKIINLRKAGGLDK
jgi:hypothetical protein